MQTTAQSVSGSAAEAASSSAATFTTVGPDGKQVTLTIPRSIEEMQALDARRDALGQQLSSAAGRRSEIASQLLATQPGPARTGLEDRLKVLDQRIIQLETDIALTGQQIAAAPGDLARVAGIATSNSGGSPDSFEDGMLIGSFMTSLAFTAVLAFRWWRGKRKGSKSAGKVTDESNQRLERLEQGMDAIAIEIERVSEGQRFVTRLLSEANPLNGRQIAPVEEKIEASR